MTRIEYRAELNRRKRRRARKIKKRITLVISFAGFMLMLGTAGASDLNAIPLKQIIIQTSIGLLMWVGGAWKGASSNELWRL